MVAALLVGTLFSVLWIDDVAIVGHVPSGLPDIALPEFAWGDLGGAVAPAVTLALLGSVNSLLTAMVADSMTRDQHRPNRELIVVGAANVVAAFIGAVPGAGATSGTVANVKAGGRSRLSGVLCALVLLALVLGLGRYAEVIPHPVLAGILIKIGFDIIDWKYLTQVRRAQLDQYGVMALTLGLSVVADLDAADPFAARTGLLSLRGIYTAASSIKLFNTINADVAEHEVVIFDFTDTRYMDDSAAYMVGQLVDVALDSGAKCIVMGIKGSQATSIKELNVLRGVPADHFVADLDEARVIAHRLLGG